MTTTSKEPELPDVGLEELLREVGARAEPSPEVMREVQTAVYAEWQSMVSERRRQRRAIAWRVAASLTIAVLIATFAQRFFAPDPVQVATISNIDGQLSVASEATATRGRLVGQAVSTGETVQTDDNSRAALAFAGDVSVRLDRSTTLTIESADHIVLTSGAVYVDAPSSAMGDAKLTIQTHAGSVRHVGTQYEVRTDTDTMIVSVREGRVAITGAAGTSTGEAGQVLRLNAAGKLTRGTMSPTDPSWFWALDATAPFDIDDQPLSAFLQWIARETGRRLVYTSPEARTAAEQVKLHGSIAGMSPDTALDAVLSTTQLRRVGSTDGEIDIELTPIDSASASRPTR